MAGLGVAIGLVALNLRPTVTSVGALLGQIQSAIDMSATFASIVVATPVVCFGMGGYLAWTVRRWWGTRRAVGVALGVVAVSLAGRVAAGPYLLWLGTIAACVGIAVLATLLPEIIQAAPERQRRRLSTWWASAFGFGPALGALATPRLAEATTWRTAAASWAVLTVVALIAWPLTTTRLFHDRDLERAHVHPWRLRPRWPATVLTIHFGLLAGVSFTFMGWLEPILENWAGLPRPDASWMFGVCMTLGVFIAPLVPAVATHRALPNQSVVVGVLSACTLAGTAGLWQWPSGPPCLGTWLWAGLVGIGTPSVVLAQVLIVLRTRDRDSTAALSAVVNGAGFGIAGVVALAVGWLYAATGSWAWSLATLVVVLAGQVITGALAGRAVVTTLPHPAEQTSQEMTHMSDSIHAAPPAGTTTGTSKRHSGDHVAHSRPAPTSPSGIPRQQRSEPAVQNGHSLRPQATAVNEPLEMLHQRLLPLTVTPTRHDPVATLIDLTTALRETITDALTQHIPAHRWQTVGDTLCTAGTVYRDLARNLADHQPAVELRCPLCGCPIRGCPTLTEALRALEAHANTSHTITHRHPRPTNPAMNTSRRLGLRRSATVDAKPRTDSAVYAMATLEHQLRAAVHSLMVDQTPSRRAAVLTPIRHRVLQLEPTLAKTAPRVLDLLTATPTGPDSDTDNHWVDNLLAADRQLCRALRALGVPAYQPADQPSSPSTRGA